MTRVLYIVLEIAVVFPKKYVKPWVTKDYISAFSSSEIPVVVGFKESKLTLPIRYSVLSSICRVTCSCFKQKCVIFLIKAGSKEQAGSSYLRLALTFSFLVCPFNWMVVSRSSGIFVLFSFPDEECGGLLFNLVLLSNSFFCKTETVPVERAGAL